MTEEECGVLAKYLVRAFTVGQPNCSSESESAPVHFTKSDMAGVPLSIIKAFIAYMLNEFYKFFFLKFLTSHTLAKAVNVLYL